METAQTVLRPVGVFGVISPFNYPVALAVNMASAALTAGNAEVLKPTPNGALVAGMLAEVVRRAYLPEGAFNLVYDAFDRTSIGGSLGAGVNLGQVLPAGLFAEVRYNFDFDDAYSTELLTVSNNAVDLWIGVTF